MWYFTWILGLGLALAFGIINGMWLEASYFSGELDEERVRKRFQRGGGRSIDCGVARVFLASVPDLPFQLARQLTTESHHDGNPTARSNPALPRTAGRCEFRR